MTNLRSAVIGACLALSLAGFASPTFAASPRCAQELTNGVAIEFPSGQPATAVEQVAADRMMAAANAMFREMAVEMNAMQRQMAAFMAMPMPSPQQIIRAAQGPGGWGSAAPGTGMVFTSVSNSSGSCSETITYSYSRTGSRPIVHVSHTGNACGTVQTDGVAPVQVETKRVTPRFIPMPRDRQLIEASDHAANRAG
ncbi:MAG: hypothetical protein ACREF3_03665 [Acetobacteraceae bacterium]